MDGSLYSLSYNVMCSWYRPLYYYFHGLKRTVGQLKVEGVHEAEVTEEETLLCYNTKAKTYPEFSLTH